MQLRIYYQKCLRMQRRFHMRPERDTEPGRTPELRVEAMETRSNHTSQHQGNCHMREPTTKVIELFPGPDEADWASLLATIDGLDDEQGTRLLDEELEQ
jgi:hypothetical protein